MGARRVGRLAVLVAAAAVAVVPEARAQKVAVVDFYGEADVRDEAGAVTILVRSTIGGDRLQVVPRAELEAAFARAQVQRAGTVRRLSLDQLRDLLVSTGASAVVTGEVLRSGAELRATALVLRSGSAIHVVTANAGDGNVAALADGLSRALAADLKTAARPRPNTSLGRLRGFVAADAALRAGEPARAIEALRAADPQASGRAAAAREPAAALLADAAQPLAARVDAALFATEPDRALELAAAALKANRSDPVAALGAARAHLSRMNVQAAAPALAPLESSSDPAVLAARAEMAHYAEDAALRDQLLDRLLAAAPAAALPVVDQVAPGGLPPALEARALTAAEGLPPSWLRSAIGVRAAAGTIEPARALALVRVSDLDEGDLALVRAAVGGAPGALPDGVRLRAELALFDADYKAARAAVDQWLAAAPDDARAHLEHGRLLVQEGKPADGAAALALAVQGGIAAARREQAMALFAAGDLAGARAILARLDDEASVLALVTGALAQLEAGDVAGARADLERALSLSVANPDLLRALTRLERERGGTPLSSDLELLADRLARPAAAAPAAAATEIPATVARKPAGGADGALEGVFDAMLRRLPLPAGARRLVVVRLPGRGLPFYHWYRLDADRIDEALHRVLERSGLSLGDAAAGEGEGELAADRLERIARDGKADAVIVYRIVPDGRSVEVELSLFIPGTPALAHVTQSFDGRATGVVGWNRLFLLAVGLLLGAALARLVVVLRRGAGALHVSFKAPPGASDEVFAIQLTRSPKRPKVDLADFRTEMARAGHKVGRRRATMVSGTTSFPRIPAGRWYAHLLGAYAIAGETRLLDEKQTVAAQVNRKAATSISFDLGGSKAELLVRIYNPGGAASGILVAVDQHTRGRTDAAGEVRLEVDPGDHTITVEGADVSMSQSVSVTAASVQRVAFHLDRERRRAEVLGDMSIPTDTGELVIERNENEKVSRAARRPQSSQGSGPPGILLSAGNLAVGDTIGKYHLVAELGRGAMGLVYRARDTKLEREVALKIISDELRSHPVAMQLFLDEAKALAQLNHPNIVGVYDQSEEMGVTYMVMELVEGHTLEEILAQRGRLPVSEALEIIDQLCAGLAYAHERKVIHRDIKPANIFVTEDRTVKLGDFGLARVMREIAIRRTEIRGTPLYMAPEQVTGTDIDRRADLYAVGCTLFEMLTGAPPFTDGDIMFQQLHAAPPRPSSKVGGLPPALDALVLSCLEKDRRARIDSATLIRERLKAVRP